MPRIEQPNSKFEARNSKQYLILKTQLQGAELNSASPISNFDIRNLNLFRILDLEFWILSVNTCGK